MVKEDLFYTREHQWLSLNGKNGKVGITDFAQRQLREITYVELPEPEAEFQAGDPFGLIESVKSTSEVYCPVDLRVMSANGELKNTPGLINQDPYGGGWLIEVEILDPQQLGSLLNAKEYEQFEE